MSSSFSRGAALVFAVLIGAEALGSRALAAEPAAFQQNDDSTPKRGGGRARGGDGARQEQRQQEQGESQGREARGTDRARPGSGSGNTTIQNVGGRNRPGRASDTKESKDFDLEDRARTAHRLERKSDRSTEREIAKHGPSAIPKDRPAPPAGGSFVRPADKDAREELREAARRAEREEQKSAAESRAERNFAEATPRAESERALSSKEPAVDLTPIRVGAAREAAEREAAEAEAAAAEASKPALAPSSSRTTSASTSEVRVNREKVRQLAELEKANRERVARLARLEELATAAADPASLQRIAELAKKQRDLYRTAMASLQQELGGPTFERARALALERKR